MKNIDSVKQTIGEQDFFAHSMHLNIHGKEEIKTSCGGFCSILQNLTVLFLFVISMITIVTFSEYDVSQSLVFHDVRKFKIDFSENIHDIAFGFMWDGKVVDMIDNEFVTVTYKYKIEFSESES